MTENTPYTGVFYAFKCDGKTKSGKPVNFMIDASFFEGKSPDQIFTTLSKEQAAWEDAAGEPVEWGDFRFVKAGRAGFLS